jgi:hypothetical protein
MKLKEALLEVSEKEHLIGKYTYKNAVLDEILIAPSNSYEFEKFQQEYILNLNAQTALAPYIQSDLRIIGVFDKWRIRYENVLIVAE